MTKPLKVLISGAGIAGVSTANWLQRYGAIPTVVERAPAPRSGGQAVDVRGAGRLVIERMGLMDSVRSVAVEQRGIAFVDARGGVMARMPADAFGGEGIVSEIEVLRGDLCRVLYEATVPAVEYLFDDTITSIEQRADGVDVAFVNAAPRRFDLVVGADGLRSVVRRLAFAPDESCVHTLGCYTAWFTAAAAGLDLDGWFVMHNAPGGRVVSARPGRPDSEVKAGLSFRDSSLAFDRSNAAQHRRILAERFAGVGWETPRLIEEMMTADDLFFESLGQVRLDCWWNDRVVLVGDAGYCPTPLTGLGTSLALVGAYMLAGEIAAADGDHRIAFSRYQELLRAYVGRGQQLPPGGINGFAPTSAAMIRLRAAAMRTVTRWPLSALIAGQFSKAGEIELPKYDTLSGGVGQPSC
jgi:2-polyprenyl-6-methoxyphenol hydroxylase-like FAD-dependent oxidoreductase